ncbi:PIN domain-containing protein [Actinoplanes sp. NPDC049316]|uniref:PIN domain-containing protein n=1 Tax=Actinoplanes sp. NPDC049316 TaxID=3154727 RepID=UPI003416BD5C
MVIVLDTHVVSQLIRAVPDPVVLAWLRQTSSTGLYTTAVTVAEIRYGIARLPEGRRRHTLHQAADEIFAAFPRQVLPFDLAAATAYADVVAGRERDGNPISGVRRPDRRHLPLPGCHARHTEHQGFHQHGNQPHRSVAGGTGSGTMKFRRLWGTADLVAKTPPQPCRTLPGSKIGRFLAQRSATPARAAARIRVRTPTVRGRARS